MFQFVYISTVATPSPDDPVPAILARSRRNNRSVGLTGVLLHRGRRFLQVLEGERAAVEATVARIRQDPRHKAIVALSEREVTARAFGDWAMASDSELSPDGIVSVVDRLTANASRNLRAQFMSYAALDTTG
jgi:hypothetical protein